MQHRILCAIRAMFIIAAVVGATARAGGATPVGLWKTIDDETGMPKSLVRISDVNGELRGVVEKVFSPPAKKPDPICDKCDGSRKDKPVVGMTIMWGLKQSGEREWTGGEILDPAKGKTYRCKVTVIEGGDKLQMRGYVAFFYRTQIWLRVE
jgi:uncharacterized protein (DUF2147 family)